MGTCRPDPRSLRRHPGAQVRQRCRRSDDTVAHRSSRDRLERRPSRREHQPRRRHSDASRRANRVVHRRGAVTAALVVEPSRRAASDLRRPTTRVARQPDNGGPRSSNEPPTGCSPDSSTSTRRDRAHGERPTGARCGSNRPRQPHVRARPRPGGSDHHLGHGRTGRTARTVHDGRRTRTRPTAGRRCRRRGRHRPPHSRRRASRSRQDAHAQDRRRRSHASKAERLRRRTHGQGSTDARTRHRDPRRHRRQAAPRMAAPRSAATPRLPTPCRRHLDRRRSRDAVDTRPVRRHQPGPPQRMATRPRRRPTTTAGRRPRRAPRRALRQRPRRTTSRRSTASPTAGKPPHR